jgi:hypothetical protein
MTRILKIDNFVNASPSFYGLEGDGACYSVTTTFSLHILISYDVKGKIGDIDYLEPSWSQYQCQEGDFITCNKSGCYIEPKISEYFVECRPTDKTKLGEPSFNKFPLESLKKIGKNLINSTSMGFEERKKITLTSGL